MTIPALAILSALMGASIAFSARVQIRTLQRPLFTTRYFVSLMLFQGMIFLPVAVYFYSFFPDWSWMYLVDTAELGNATPTMTMALYPVAAVMGYLIGYFSARSSGDWITVTFMVFMIIGAIGLFAVAGNKVAWVGSFEQYHRAVGLRGFGSTSLLPSTIVAGCGMGVCWFYLIYKFVQEGRHAIRA